MHPVQDDDDDHPLVREYARDARSYDSRWSAYVRTTTEETVARLALQPGDHVLDVGCGTGVLLERLSRVHPAACLSGVDPVAEMLTVARERLDAAVDLRQAWAEELPFDAETFDLVVSGSVFHFIHAPDTALAEMRRVLRPHGRLVISDWCRDYATVRLLDLWLRLTDRAHFRTWGRRDLRRLLEAGGFAVERVDRYRVDWMWGMMTVSARKS